MPVLPLVGSRMVHPGRRVPSFSPCSTILRAARSLIEPVGFWSSSLAQTRTSGDGESRGNPTSGVPPTVSSRLSNLTPSLRSGRRTPRHQIAGPTRDGGEDDDLVAVVQRGLERAGEADVLVVDVDVDETAQLGAVE